LRCEAYPVRPALSYSLQLRTGYVIDVPLNQFRGSGHKLSILSRVTPEGRDPVYLDGPALVPDLSTAKADAEFTGSYVVGEGMYGVETLVRDDAGRTCYNQWRIQAKRSGSERDLKAAVPAGAVQEVAAPVLAGVPAQGPEIERLTILVHAAAMNPRAARMNPETARTLADSLSSLLTQLPAKSVRLAVFNLDKQALLLNKEPFRGSDLEEVTRAFEQLQLAVVDYKTVENREKVDVLSDLAVKELRNPKPASAVILIGPRTTSQTDTSLAAGLRPAGAPWFYLQYQPFDGMQRMGGPRVGGPTLRGGTSPTGSGNDNSPLPPIGPAELPDGIERLVHRLNGAIFPVRVPHDLADAIHRMATRIRTVDEPGSAAPLEPPPAPPQTLPATRTATPEPPGPAGDEDPEDPVEVLAHLRDLVVKHAANVPNHTCVETVQRNSYEPFAGRARKSCDSLLAARKQIQNRLLLDLTDWLRLDVGMADGREIFSWVGAPRFEEGEIDELIPEGAFGTGPFASMLLSLFESRNPHFLFAGAAAADGRRVLEYSFRVPIDESQYRVKARGEWIVTGYSGSLLVDPRTSELVRFAVRTEELPAETEACEVDTTLDYGMVPLGGFEYLLPQSTRQRFIGLDGAEAENSVSFASCREFLGESTLTFGKSPASTGHSVNAPPAAALPAGLSLDIELTSSLTFGKAAAGDRIEGRLTEPLRDAKARQVLAPAGAKAVGRLTRVELRHSGSGEYTVALRWETLEIEGGKVPLNLKPNRQMARLKAIARGALQQRGMPIDLPRPGEERDGIYRFPGQRTGVEGGLRTEWVTTTER
jgi:hypothetical protein